MSIINAYSTGEQYDGFRCMCGCDYATILESHRHKDDGQHHYILYLECGWCGVVEEEHITAELSTSHYVGNDTA